MNEQTNGADFWVLQVLQDQDIYIIENVVDVIILFNLF